MRNLRCIIFEIRKTAQKAKQNWYMISRLHMHCIALKVLIHNYVTTKSETPLQISWIMCATMSFHQPFLQPLQGGIFDKKSTIREEEHHFGIEANGLSGHCSTRCFFKVEFLYSSAKIVKTFFDPSKYQADLKKIEVPATHSGC